MSVIIDNLILSSISEIRNNPEMVKKTSLHINAAEEVETEVRIHNLLHIDLNWYDSPSQDINENGILFHLVKLMDSYISCGKQVLVNCFAGISRSTTIVLAYLMYKNKWTVQHAISFVTSKRNIINPNYGFVAQLYNLQDKLHTLDDHFTQYCANFKNKTPAEIQQEITSTTVNNSFIDNIRRREFAFFNDIPTGLNNPFIVFYPDTTNSLPYAKITDGGV